MRTAGPQGNHRKTFAVKHQDGEPLTRADLQYDILYYLFTDPQAVFNDPFTTLHGDPAGTKVTFRDLYINTLIHSPRCSKISREKLHDNPHFADEFSKMALLSNVGRINTTMAFFPEMRTALRTYHPVPSLQKTDGNLQDAPRIKNILKSCLLPSELQNTPTTPPEVLNRSRSGTVPPTTIVNLIFIFASHASLVAQTHFPPNTPFDILDFFSPVHVSSESRARAFLWLCHHYYESTSPNPFDDAQSRKNPGQIPALEFLSPEEAQLENVDTPEEKVWGEKMTAQRKLFMENKDKLDDGVVDYDETPREKVSGRGRGRGRARRTKAQDPRPSVKASHSVPAKGESSSESRNSVAHDANMAPQEFPHPLYQIYSPESYRLPPVLPPHPSPPPLPPPSRERSRTGNNSHRFTSPYHGKGLSSDATGHATLHGGPVRNHLKTSRRQPLPPLHHVNLYDEQREFPLIASLPYPHAAIKAPRTPPRGLEGHHRRANHPSSPQTGTRSMLEQAWHVVTTTDPLEDSEDEMDENTRLDLLLRLKIINRLRGKEPTPEPELRPTAT